MSLKLVNWDLLKAKRSTVLIVDLSMLLIAIINFSIFSFDYTYLSVRNFYFHYIPFVVQYDAIKGIMPHRSTDEYLNKSKSFFDNFNNSEQRENLRLEMIHLSIKMIEEDPFKIANKSGELEVVKDRVKKFMKVDSSKKAFKAFWESVDYKNIEQSKEFFEQDIKWIIETNYWRSIDKTGDYTDYYRYIDSVFVAVFILEFLFMWSYSIRKVGEDEKILYPIYHWYDIVSCIPLQSFRALRLLRIIAVYNRLVKSGILIESNGPVTRRIKKYKNILNEEISANTGLNLLDDIEDDIKAGKNRNLVQETLLTHKDAIKVELVKNIKHLQKSLLSNNQKVLSEFIALILEDTIKTHPEYKKIRDIPYLGDKVSSFVSKNNLTKISEQSFNTFSKSLDSNLNKPEGEELLNKIIEDVIDEVILIMQDEIIKDLMDSISIKVVEELKKSTQIRKWKKLEY